MGAVNPMPSPMAQGQMPQDPLAALKDIHLPAPSPWWDLAIGWWILAVFVIGLLIWGLPKLVQYWKAQRGKKALKADMQQRLQAICEAYAQHKNAAALIADINILLKQVMLTVLPAQNTASLTGKAWLNHLDSVWQQKPEHTFSKQPIAGLLEDGAYRSSVAADEQAIQTLCNTVQAWLQAVAKHV